jgi:flagellar motility protein MotE (MotC chaperone)
MRTRKPILLLLVVLVSLTAGVTVTAEGEEPDAAVVANIDSVEQRRILFALQQERAQLQAEYAKKEKNLDLKEIELKTLAGEVDKKLTQLQEVRDELRKLLEKKDEVEAQRIQALGKMYEKMEPARGAALLAELDQELAVQILSGIKSKVAGQLLANMPQEKATQLSVAYSTLVED